MEAGDGGALPLDTADLYARFAPMVLRRCRRLLGEEEAARDAMHDTFVRVLSHAETLEASAPSSLLWTTATRVCLNRLRSQRRRPEVIDGELLLRIAVDDDLEGRTGAAAMLERLFGREPEGSREIAVMHLLDGMTHEEVAEAVGLSVSGVRKRLRTMRARLEALEVAT